MGIRTLRLDLTRTENSDEIFQQIQDTMPSNLTNLRIRHPVGREQLLLDKHPSLEKLALFTLGNWVPSLLSSLQSLYLTIEADDIIRDECFLEISPNLERLEFNLLNKVEDIQMLTKNACQLKSFGVVHFLITTVLSLCLPESTITHWSLEMCPILEDYSAIRDFKQLKFLEIISGPFPPELLLQNNGFPNLTKFRFTVDNSAVTELCLDDAVFPETLMELQVTGRVVINNWVPPPKLRVLALWGCQFPHGIQFTLPDDVNEIDIQYTD
ncbi:hypothetical protein Cantr_00660 [Candida viswanathii]|uniref:Uncharacterized protein n=1 Tax=Candida viswanathii TaxID=5486 RepID=A0A367YGY8_9ASCO|nr:hypothetical protein Cantr_00660 [Candida viswanathii]